jgi:hypothetical protein
MKTKVIICCLGYYFRVYQEMEASDYFYCKVRMEDEKV